MQYTENVVLALSLSVLCLWDYTLYDYMLLAEISQKTWTGYDVPNLEKYRFFYRNFQSQL